MQTNSMTPERIAELREVSSDGDDSVPNASIMTELLHEIEELTTDRDEWKRIAKDNIQGMIVQKAIIDRLEKEIELYGN